MGYKIQASDSDFWFGWGDWWWSCVGDSTYIGQSIHNSLIEYTWKTCLWLGGINNWRKNEKIDQITAQLAANRNFSRN